MKSFTALSPAGMDALKAAIAASPVPYDLSLNCSDMTRLTEGLYVLATSTSESSEISDWASSVLSDFATTFDIEFI